MKKQDLSTKMCPVCDRPFSWRKKWERDWDEVKYCSERCRRAAKKLINDRIGKNNTADPRGSVK